MKQDHTLANRLIQTAIRMKKSDPDRAQQYARVINLIGEWKSEMGKINKK